MPIQDTNINKNHAIPQNIMDVEFKIIGDLTLRQFLYAFIFGMLAYIIISNDLGVIKWPIGIFFAVFGLALAFVPIQDRGMDVWIVNFIKSVFNPTQMVWSKSAVLPPVFLYESVNILKQELITLAPTSSRRKLEEYLDYTAQKKELDPLDIPEDEYINKVRKAYANVSPMPSTKVSSVSDLTIKRPVVEGGYPEPEIKPSPQKSSTKSIIPSTNLIKGFKDMGSNIITKIEPTFTSKSTKVDALKSEQLPKLEDKNIILPTKQLPTEQQQTKVAEKLYDVPKPVSTSEKVDVVSKSIPYPDSTTKNIQITSPVSKGTSSTIAESQKPEVIVTKPEKIEEPVINIEPISDDVVEVTPLTPDRHSGRVFTSFIPSKGELILPVRGERVLSTSDEENVRIQKDVQAKTQQLQELIQNIRKVEENPISSTNKNININTSKDNGASADKDSITAPDSNNITNTNKEVNNITKTNNKINETPTKEIFENTNSIAQNTNKKSNDIVNNTQNYAMPRKKNNEFSDKKIQAKSISTVASNSNTAFNNPNIINGVVKDNLGKLMPDTLVIIKNKNLEPIRAVKTNKIGQFLLSSPLSNGTYYIDISKNSSRGLNFDTISVNAQGDVLPFIELKGN